MGPLWAWVILWFVSAYGLVLLLRRSMFQTPDEPVPVLVATPKPAPVEAPLDSEAAIEATVPEAEELVVSIPALEGVAIAQPQEAPDEPLAPAIQAIEGEVDLRTDEVPQDDEVLLPTAAEVVEQAAAIPASPQDAPEDEAATPSEPWIKEREGAEASEPWIQEREETAASEPWIPDPEEPTADAPWIQEREEREASEPWRPDAAESSVEVAATEPDADDDEVLYRAIDLENLTLGLEATEIQSLYGSPGHLSKLGEDGEQWRYPLNATDERGAGVQGVLVLEFQRGRLVRKSLEEGQAEA